MKSLNALILTASLGLAAAPSAWADVVFNTTSGLYWMSINQNSAWAQSFQTGPSASTLTDVVLRMGAPDNAAGNFAVKLYNNSGNVPGTSLATLAGSANPATAGAYTYTGAQALAPSSTYWVVAGVASGAGTYNWLKSNGNPPSPGASVGMAQNFYGTWDGPYGENFSMQVDVDGTAVPEPGQWAMMGVTLAGVVGFLVRQRRAKLKAIAA